MLLGFSGEGPGVAGYLGAAGEEQGHSVCSVESGSQARDEKEPQNEDIAVDGGSRTVTGLARAEPVRKGTMNSCPQPPREADGREVAVGEGDQVAERLVTLLCGLANPRTRRPRVMPSVRLSPYPRRRVVIEQQATLLGPLSCEWRVPTWRHQMQLAAGLRVRRPGLPPGCRQSGIAVDASKQVCCETVDAAKLISLEPP